MLGSYSTINDFAPLQRFAVWKQPCVAGDGWCGRGLASRAHGMGAQVMSMAEAAKIGDFFCTVTGDINVIDGPHFEVMKKGAIVANFGHFNVEINIPALQKMSVGEPNLVRPFVD